MHCHSMQVTPGTDATLVMDKVDKDADVAVCRAVVVALPCPLAVSPKGVVFPQQWAPVVTMQVSSLLVHQVAT